MIEIALPITLLCAGMTALSHRLKDITGAVIWATAFGVWLSNLLDALS